MKKLLLKNATLYTPINIIKDGVVLIEENRIKFVGERRNLVNHEADRVIDCFGQHLTPGLIDLQLNGGFGKDFTQNPSSIWQTGVNLPKFGVTAFLPTIISSPPEKMETAQEIVLEGPPNEYQGAKVLGLHYEGPFLAPDNKGAHNLAHLRTPSLDLYGSFSPQNGVQIVTLAPELPGADAVIKQLINQGVLVSAGHSNATYEQAKTAFDQGIRYGTHLFNAMPRYHHREPGLIGALLDDERITSGLIVDGIHVHPSTVRLAWNILGPNRLTLVTDAMAGLGYSPGEYLLGEKTVFVDQTSARLQDGTLAGSNLSANMAIRNLITFTGCQIHHAIQTMSLNPAKILGLDSTIGQLKTGLKADLVLLTNQFEAMMTIIDGKIVYQDENL